MFYRRKVILSIIQAFGGTLGKTQLQKLLLLFCVRQKKPDYDFVPYKYGGYSFSLAADINAMGKKGLLSISNEGVIKKDKIDYSIQLKESDRLLLKQLFVLHKDKAYRELIRYTYTKYPYYAIKSSIADRYLDENELLNVEKVKPIDDNKVVLYTIGYEGISLEEYLNKLISRSIKVLVDVRNNPQSMKYGFSKTQLINSCKNVDIEYVHFPEVGIPSNQRQELNIQSDYDCLFDKYITDHLPNTIETQQKILNLLKDRNKIALTCFEADVCQCHRKHLAESIIKLEGWEYELTHIL